jgi:hypothetical protein
MSNSNKENYENALNKKLEEISRSLLAEPTKEELNSMQIHIDAIQKWDEINRMMRAIHDDDTTEHHHHY